MCRENLQKLCGLGLCAGLAFMLFGCPAQQTSHAPATFWSQRDLEDVRAFFEAKLTPNKGSGVEGFGFHRTLRFKEVEHHEVHMFEVLTEMRHHLVKAVERKGGEIVGRVAEAGDPAARFFEFNYRKAKFTGVVRGEVKRSPRHPQHWDLICEVKENHYGAQ